MRDMEGNREIVSWGEVFTYKNSPEEIKRLHIYQQEILEPTLLFSDETIGSLLGIRLEASNDVC